MFRKQLAKPTEEWVIDFFGQVIPLRGVTVFVNGFMCVIIAYFMYNIGAMTAVQVMDYVSTPKSVCSPTGECTYCIPHASGTQIIFNCSTINAESGGKIGIDYQYALNQTVLSNFTPSLG